MHFKKQNTQVEALFTHYIILFPPFSVLSNGPKESQTIIQKARLESISPVKTVDSLPHMVTL